MAFRHRRAGAIARALAASVAILATVALAGCGGSGDSALQQQTLADCMSHGTPTRAACQCAIRDATGAGVDLGTLDREIKDGSAIRDQRAVDAALLCAGAR